MNTKNRVGKVKTERANLPLIAESHVFPWRLHQNAETVSAVPTFLKHGMSSATVTPGCFPTTDALCAAFSDCPQRFLSYLLAANYSVTVSTSGADGAL